MKVKLAAWESSTSKNTQDFRLIDLSGEFLPGGSYLPTFAAKFLCVMYLMIKYCKKKKLEKEKNSLAHSILQGNLISRIQQVGKRILIYWNYRQLALKLLLRISGGSMIQYNRVSKAKKKEIYKDLCSTCNYGELCVSKKTRQGPVWFCEEFDGYVAVKEQEVYEAGWQPAQSRVGPGIMEKDTSQFMGLCIHCENRFTCINSKTEGGIWHCEEYK